VENRWMKCLRTTGSLNEAHGSRNAAHDQTWAPEAAASISTSLARSAQGAKHFLGSIEFEPVDKLQIG